MTTVILEVITSVTDKPTNAQAYCVDRFPRLRAIPPPIANRIDGQLSCIISLLVKNNMSISAARQLKTCKFFSSLNVREVFSIVKSL